MRKLWPNLEREDGLDTVLEVPMPEETFLAGGVGSRSSKTFCTNVKAWMRPHVSRAMTTGSSGAELQLMLGVIGAPLVPLPVHAYNSTVIKDMKEDTIEVSMARYIVQQYIAASGGDQALNAIHSMYAMGKVRMMATEMSKGNGGGSGDGAAASGNGRKARKGLGNVGEIGGFVLWQKKPDLWCLELMVSGSKISAGSDGKVAWRQTPWNQSHASRGPPRPLRRSLQVPNTAVIDPMIFLIDISSTYRAHQNRNVSGARSEIDGELIRQVGVPRGEGRQRRGLLRAAPGRGGDDPSSAQQQQRRNHPPHRLGLLQPAYRPPRPARGLAPPPHQNGVSQGLRILGDHHGVSHRRLPHHRRRQHRARRPHQRLALPVRGDQRQTLENTDGGDVDGGGGGLQHLGALHGLLPAAQGPQGGEGRCRNRRRSSVREGRAPPGKGTSSSCR
ncbi:uncharacterized protein LOC121999998 isoform X1 [Zingiber officinale]|uniref:uncharacterized protein LOC121999998 isoform X1 n=1 Tax=Zingiber officinale TaxID=94328 RepID=UPI001C4D001B|nr:uncharacterized protein LOC121999998 isoform X1 [Zingiber officinale]